MTGAEIEHGDFSVFFDGNCPLCIREIDFYRRQRGADAILWIDLAQAPNETVAPGLSCQAALAKFHVQTRSGELLQGGTAFAALWQELPKFKTIGNIARRAPFRWVLNLGYTAFLPLRPALQRLAGRIWKPPKPTA